MAAVMASGGYCSRLPISLRMDSPRPSSSNACYDLVSQQSLRALKSNTSETFGQRIVDNEVKKVIVDGSRIASRSNPGRLIVYRKSSPIRASWLPSCQIASSAFTFGTVAVLPFYASMVVAPGTEFTKKLMSSAITYVILGVAYSYLLYRSWTPDTIGLLFASKYWLPELSGMARMFSSNMTLASAWIHLLVVDLFAARQIYFDGLHDNIETRHSVLLCLMCCPIGILCHFITRAITRIIREGKHGITNKDLLDVKTRKPADEKEPTKGAFSHIEVIMRLLKEIGRAVIAILATSIL